LGRSGQYWRFWSYQNGLYQKKWYGRFRQRLKRNFHCCLLLAVSSIFVNSSAYAYYPAIHESLTKLAIERYNHCQSTLGLPEFNLTLANLISEANSHEDTQFIFKRILNWHFYDVNKEEKKLLFFDTRLHRHFNALELSLLSRPPDMTERGRLLGALLHYIQDVSVPAHVAPIFHPRLELPAQDSFDEYPVAQLWQNRENLEKNITCPQFNRDLQATIDATDQYNRLLDRVALQTRVAITQPIADLPVTWNAFWLTGEKGEFGEYGIAGNHFGEQVSIPCAESICKIEAGDKIYVEFAFVQHRLAIQASVDAIYLMLSLANK